MLKTIYRYAFYASAVVDLAVDFSKHLLTHGPQNTFLLIFGFLWLREEIIHANDNVLPAPIKRTI